MYIIQGVTKLIVIKIKKKYNTLRPKYKARFIISRKFRSYEYFLNELNRSTVGGKICYLEILSQ